MKASGVVKFNRRHTIARDKGFKYGLEVNPWTIEGRGIRGSLTELFGPGWPSNSHWDVFKGSTRWWIGLSGEEELTMVLLAVGDQL